MRFDRALLGLNALSIMLALAAALVWPRPGQAALIVPLGANDMRSVLRWAERENSALLALDTASGRVVARISDNRSLMRAIGNGLLPIAVRAEGCGRQRKG